MKRSGARTALLAAAVAAGVVPLHAGDTTSAAGRGKRIYSRSIGSSAQEIVAFMGDAEVPASVLPCASCHGPDGEGRPEGGVTPPGITWESLTKPYGVTRGSGRRRPPYTAATLARAIGEGVDPAGQKLLAAMPRYRMTREDMDDLVAFLKVLGKDSDPGITDTTITLGTFVAPSGRLAGIGEETRAVLATLFDGINGQGGIFNRKVVLRALRPPHPGEATDAGRRLEQEGVFALVGGVMDEPDRSAVELAEGREIPWVGPIVADPEAWSPASRFVFYLFPGTREQALALVSFAARDLPQADRRAAVLHPDTAAARSIAEPLAERCRSSGWGSVARIGYPPGLPEFARLAREGKDEQITAVFFLGSGGALKELLGAAAEQGWTPRMFVLGSLAGREVLAIPAAFDRRVFLAFPTTPPSPDPAEGRDSLSLLDRRTLSPPHGALQLWAYTAGKILVEGLRLAGRRLTRERLVDALEGLYEYDAGLTPRVTYGPNRRIGLQGATIVAIDSRRQTLVRVSDWIALE